MQPILYRPTLPSPSLKTSKLRHPRYPRRLSASKLKLASKTTASVRTIATMTMKTTMTTTTKAVSKILRLNRNRSTFRQFSAATFSGLWRH